MINRDFTKSNKHYINRNKFVLIAISAILVIGAIMLCVFGFKGGADISGYNTFSINMGSVYKLEELDDYTEDINECLSKQNAELYSVQVTGEGELTTLVVKYRGNVKDEAKLNSAIAEDLEVSVSNISKSTKVSPSVTSKDYIYTIAGGLIILTIAMIFIAFRYNLACAMTSFATSLVGVMLLMALTGILRLTINSSFLAINIITMLLILGETFMVFDSLEKERAKVSDKNDRSTQLKNALKANSFRQKFMYGAIFAICLIFVILMPSTIKQASLIMLFALVVILFMTVYAIPFVWCLTITQVSDKIRVKKEKVVKAQQKTEIAEGELEQNYTENQVIEVKEDNGDTPSNDDNIVIE